jgi:hypothetical protein
LKTPATGALAPQLQHPCMGTAPPMCASTRPPACCTSSHETAQLHLYRGHSHRQRYISIILSVRLAVSALQKFHSASDWQHERYKSVTLTICGEGRECLHSLARVRPVGRWGHLQRRTTSAQSTPPSYDTSSQTCATQQQQLYHRAVTIS